MTTYANFQAYVIRTHWRSGDTDFATDLPLLIAEAEKRIIRDISDNHLIKEVTLSFTANIAALPSDFKELVSLQYSDEGVSKSRAVPAYITMEEIHENDPKGRVHVIYGGSIRANVGDNNMTLYYHYEPEAYSTEPSSPFYDDYPDFYMAAVNIRVYDYLKDHDLEAAAEQKYDKLLESMLLASNRHQFPSGNSDVPLPGCVS